ncbi:MAG: hypothetical protein GY775_16830 [Candidatus Scalindua sp.]|nr:hypothetical protein [Candidatus Scalindua sp.]
MEEYDEYAKGAICAKCGKTFIVVQGIIALCAECFESHTENKFNVFKKSDSDLKDEN